MMREFLAELFQTVLIAAVPVITVFICRGISTLSGHLAARMENQIAKKYLEDAANAVERAVAYTNQVYVDALKKSGSFSRENQQKALEMALDKAVGLLTEDAVRFLEKAYGDLTEYLSAHIEAEVRTQKSAAPVK